MRRFCSASDQGSQKRSVVVGVVPELRAFGQDVGKVRMVAVGRLPFGRSRRSRASAFSLGFSFHSGWFVRSSTSRSTEFVTLRAAPVMKCFDMLAPCESCRLQVSRVKQQVDSVRAPHSREMIQAVLIHRLAFPSEQAGS